jgi:hypothetical protein
MRLLHPGFLMLSTGALEREPDIGDEALLDPLLGILGEQGRLRLTRPDGGNAHPPKG